MAEFHEQANKLKELIIRLELLSEVATPYTLDTMRDSDRRYFFMKTILPRMLDEITFINKDIKSVIEQLEKGA